jgi:2-amino-4-hydroxy-6-hydroxymethyldihydropteridine diphosphokinase
MTVIGEGYKIFGGLPIHFVALGANLPGPHGQSPQSMCESAILAIANLPGIVVEARSRWFSTAPIPAGPQPRYLNGIVRIRGNVTPSALLADLQKLELSAGRRRGAVNAARPLDLDIIDMNSQVRTTPDPILPHPRAHLRAFVLLPLRDVAPHWIHPSLGLPINTLLRALPEQDIRVA